MCVYFMLSIGCCYSSESSIGQLDIAVVKCEFDRVDEVLRRFRIPYKEISYKDIEGEETYSKYRAIFFPCGIGLPVESNVSVLSRRSKIEAVLLRDGYYEIDKKRVFASIVKFVNGGGSAYFSGYSFEYLQGAYNPLEFFDEFPFMGMSGKIDMTFKDNLVSFSGIKKITLPVKYSGWVALKSIKESEVLAEGIFETPRGIRSGPIAAIMPREKGEVLYTSYHSNTTISDLTRFMIYRIAYRFMLTGLLDLADGYGQRVNGSIIDSVLGSENCRIYRLELKRGMNAICFVSEGDNYQIDVFDDGDNLIASTAPGKKSFSIDITSDVEKSYNIKVYPSQGDFFKPYALVSASGERIHKPLYWLLYILIPVFLLVALLLIKRYAMPRKFSGRNR
jgi:hypothetical protein